MVGCGPAGLAAAVELKRRGFDKVVALVRDAPDEFEAAKAYLYLVDRRGQRWTDAVGATDGIRARGVSNEGFSLTRIYPDEKGIFPTKPVLARPGAAQAVWIPRASLLAALAERAADDGADLRAACRSIICARPTTAPSTLRAAPRPSGRHLSSAPTGRGQKCATSWQKSCGAELRAARARIAVGRSHVQDAPGAAFVRRDEQNGRLEFHDAVARRLHGALALDQAQHAAAEIGPPAVARPGAAAGGEHHPPGEPRDLGLRDGRRGARVPALRIPAAARRRGVGRGLRGFRHRGARRVSQSAVRRDGGRHGRRARASWSATRSTPFPRIWGRASTRRWRT